MAALRIFARPSFSMIFTKPSTINIAKITLVNDLKIQERYSSFRSSPKVGDPSLYTDFEVSKDPKEWLFVERILAAKTVPSAPVSVDKEFPSGWKAPCAEAKKLPYFVDRTKNHMFPVYLNRSFRGMRRITILRRIQGDIWALHNDLKQFLEEKANTKLAYQIHEVAGFIRIHGDRVSHVREWLASKGF